MGMGKGIVTCTIIYKFCLAMGKMAQTHCIDGGNKTVMVWEQ